MKRGCAVCSSEETDLLFQQTFVPAASGSLLDGYDVVACRACGFAYADGLPPQEDFDRHYREMSKYEGVPGSSDDSPFEAARARDIAALIARFIPRPTSPVVEVGCATGRLLGTIRASGFPDVVGIDPSPICAEQAARLHGVTVRTGTITSLPAAVPPADMLVLVGVLEHVRDLGAALESVRRLISPGGRVYVEVPDVEGFTEWLDAPFQQFSTEHIAFFSTISLDGLMRRHRFAPLHLERLARRATADSTMPVLAAVFEDRGAPLAGAGRDERSAPALRAYIEASRRAEEEGIPELIDGLVTSRRAIVVWGVGTLTARLLSTTRLGEANIRAFVDSNPKMQGRKLRGRPILPPESLREMPDPVLICSRVFRSEIERQIRETLGCANELVLI